MNTDIKYKHLLPETQAWMKQLIATVQKDKDIPEAYEVSLDLIADSVELYFKALKDVDKYGILIINAKGFPIKNPAMSVINNQQAYISKMLTLFGLTKSSKLKLDRINTADSGTEDLEDFLS